jgi:membrane protease YdiL (CAAX protease family)
MPSEGLLALLFSLFSTAISFLITWVITRFIKPKKLEAKFAVPRKEALLSIAYVIAAFLVLAGVFFFWSQSIGRSIGTSEEYDISRVLFEWGIYAMISFIPVFAILKIRHQSLQSVGLAKTNWRLSIGVGILLSACFLAFNTTPERFLDRAFTFNTLYGFMYFLAVGFGDELLFRGFLQLRCSAWLGETKGLAVTSVLMAFVHLPQRIFVVGQNPIEAVFSATLLIPVSLLMGFLMLRTQNVLGPTVLHTMIDMINIL